MLPLFLPLPLLPNLHRGKEMFYYSTRHIALQQPTVSANIYFIVMRIIPGAIDLHKFKVQFSGCKMNCVPTLPLPLFDVPKGITINKRSEKWLKLKLKYSFR